MHENSYRLHFARTRKPGTTAVMTKILSAVRLYAGLIPFGFFVLNRNAPGQFVVDTPSGTTVDLGCACTLQVDDSGAGVVRTSLGWVGFKLNGREAFIPAGAVAGIRPKIGPGTPYFDDASAKFRSALARFDFDDNTPQMRARDLLIVLDEARNRDTLTLWHLLGRTEAPQRALVYRKLAEFVPPPAGVTEEGILRLDSSMMDRWWNELGFDDIAVWRRWERNWSGAGSAK